MDGSSSKRRSSYIIHYLWKRINAKKKKPTANVGYPNVILSTQEIEKAYDQMKENGLEVGELQVMPYGKMFSFKDQDGNAYLLREDK